MFINPTHVSAATKLSLGDDGFVAAETHVGLMNIPKK
jgi:hypothetical protein